MSVRVCHSVCVFVCLCVCVCVNSTIPIFDNDI